MEIKIKLPEDLSKYCGYNIGIVTKYFSRLDNKDRIGLIIGKLESVELIQVRTFPSYDDYYNVTIGGNDTEFHIINKIFSDPTEALAYYEYLGGI